jgi:hypothetical protein
MKWKDTVKMALKERYGLVAPGSCYSPVATTITKVCGVNVIRKESIGTINPSYLCKIHSSPKAKSS